MTDKNRNRADVISHLVALKGRESNYALHQVPTTAHVAPGVRDLIKTVDFFVSVFDTPVGRVDEVEGLWCDLRFGPFQLVPHEAVSGPKLGGSLVGGKVSPIPHVGLLFYDEEPFREVVRRVNEHPHAAWYNGIEPYRRWEEMLGEQETGFVQVADQNLWIEFKWFIHGQRATFAPDLHTPASV